VLGIYQSLMVPANHSATLSSRDARQPIKALSNYSLGVKNFSSSCHSNSTLSTLHANHYTLLSLNFAI